MPKLEGLVEALRHGGRAATVYASDVAPKDEDGATRAHALSKLLFDLAAAYEEGRPFEPVDPRDHGDVFFAAAVALDKHVRPSSFRTIEVNEVQITQSGLAETMTTLQWEIDTGRDGWERT